MVVHVLFFILFFDVEKKRKHTLNKHPPPPIIPVEGALRMLQAHAAPRTLPVMLFGRSGTPRVNKQCRLPGRKIWVRASFGQPLCRYSPRCKKVALYV